MANLDQLPTEVPDLFKALEETLNKQTFDGIPLLKLTPADIVDPLFEGIQDRVKQELEKAKSGAKELTANLVQQALFAALQPILLDSDGKEGITATDIQLPTDGVWQRFQRKTAIWYFFTVSDR